MSETTVTLRIAGNSTGAADALKVVDADLKKVQSTAKDTEGQAQKMSASWTKAGVAMGTAIAATATAMVVMTAKASNAADQVGKLAERFGMSSQEVSGFSAAAQLAGASSNAFAQSLGSITRAVTGAAGGQKQFRQLFADMGIEVKNAAGEVRGLGELLPEIANRFAQYEDGPAKAALATKLFGEAGLELLPFLSKGSAGIEALREKAASLGLVLDGQTTSAASEFKDNLSTLGLVMDGMFNSLARQLLPNLKAFTGSLVEQATQSGKSKDSLTGVATILRSVGKFFLEVARAAEIFGASFAYTVDEVIAEARAMGERLEIVRVRLTAFATYLSGNIKSANLMRSMADEAEKQLNNRLSRSLANAQEALDDTFAETDKKYQPLIRAFTGQLADFGNVVSTVTGSAIKKGKPPVVEFGGACKVAAEEVKELGVEIEALVDPSAEVLDLLSDTAAEMGGPVVAAALRYRDELVRIATLQAALLEQGPPTAEAAGQFEALTRAAKNAGDDYQRVQAGNMDADGAFLDNSEEVAREWESTWGNVVDSISGAFGDFIAGNIRSFKDFGRSLLQIARNFLADMVQRFASTQLRLNFAASASGGGGGGGGAGSFAQTAAGGAGSVSGLITGAGAVATGLGMTSLGAGLAYTGAAGIGAGFSAGATLLGAGGSAAISIGMMLPAIGLAVAAIYGLYTILNKDKPPALTTIGSDVVGTSGFRNLAPGSTYDSALGGFTFASIDSVDRETRDQMGGAIADFDNAVASFLDDEQLARVTSALATFNLHLEEGAITAENIIGARWDAILNTFPEDIQAIVRGAGDLADQVQKLGEVLQFPKLIEDILAGFKDADALAGMTEFERSVMAVNKQFDEAKAALIAMGATEAQLAEIETYRANALERLAQLQQDQLDALLDPLWFEDLTEGMTPSEREIARINKYYDDLKEQAIALGATQEELALIERRRNAALSDAIPILEQTVDVLEELPNVLSGLDQLHDDSSDGLDDWRRAMQQVRDFLNGERYSATSTLTPEQMLQEARTQFSDLLFRAQQGDVGAAGALTGAAQRLLELGRSYYASGDEYDTLRAAVLGALGPFGALSTQPQFQLHEAMNALRLAFVNFADALTRGANLPGQAANSVAYAGGESATVGELRALGTKLDRLERAVSAGADKQASVVRESMKRGVT